MGNVCFTAKVNEDNSLTLPAFAVRGMGYEPGEDFIVSIPIEQPSCEFNCGNTELFVARCCEDSYCMGYSSAGEEVNIPPRLFSKADITPGVPVYLMAGDNALVLVAGTGLCEDLPHEVETLLEELGIEVCPRIALGNDF